MNGFGTMAPIVPKSPHKDFSVRLTALGKHASAAEKLLESLLRIKKPELGSKRKRLAISLLSPSLGVGETGCARRTCCAHL